MIDWIFSGIGLALIPMVYFYLINRKKKNIIRDIENEIHQKDDSQNRLKASIKEFNSYVPIDIYFFNNYIGKCTYAVNKFREELKYNDIYPKLNIIFGDAGSGKSILMTYFCYSYCQYHSLEQRKKFNNLYDRGVIYIRFLHFRDMEQLMNRIRNDLLRYPNISLLILDGFDEFREINNKKAEDLISVC